MKTIVILLALFLLALLGPAAAAQSQPVCYACRRVSPDLQDTMCTSVGPTGQRLTSGATRCSEVPVKDGEGHFLYTKCVIFGCCYVVAP